MDAVELFREGTGLTGTVGDLRVELDLDLPNSRGGVRGQCLGATVDGYWRIESNFQTLDQVALFLGDYGGSPVFLRNEVHLGPAVSLRYAELTGTIGDDELTARISPAEAPALGPTVVGIDGLFAGETITLFAGIEATGWPHWAKLDGQIGGGRVSLDVQPESVSGDYDGPDVLFPILLGSLMFFV